MKLTKDMVVFITGGASGLGEATVRDLHAVGCKVVVADMNEERLELLKNELKENIVCVKCDVTKEEDVKKAIDEAIKTFGTIHVALACAGIAPVTPTLTSKGPLDINVFKKTMDINVYGSIYVAKYASIAMSKN